MSVNFHSRSFVYGVSTMVLVLAIAVGVYSVVRSPVSADSDPPIKPDEVMTPTQFTEGAAKLPTGDIKVSVDTFRQVEEEQQYEIVPIEIKREAKKTMSDIINQKCPLKKDENDNPLPENKQVWHIFKGARELLQELTTYPDLTALEPTGSISGQVFPNKYWKFLTPTDYKFKGMAEKTFTKKIIQPSFSKDSSSGQVTETVEVYAGIFSKEAVLVSNGSDGGEVLKAFSARGDVEGSYPKYGTLKIEKSSLDDKIIVGLCWKYSKY